MIACVDVDYRDDSAIAACVLFRDWADAVSTAEHVRRIDRVEPYQPGQFYKREMPCLLAVLAEVAEPLETVVVDGYVWLADEGEIMGVRHRSWPLHGVQFHPESFLTLEGPQLLKNFLEMRL